MRENVEARDDETNEPDNVIALAGQEVGILNHFWYITFSTGNSF